VRKSVMLLVAVSLGLVAPGVVHAATPANGGLTANAQGTGSVSWTGTVTSTPATAGGTTDLCFDDQQMPDMSAGCDFFVLDVSTPDKYYEGRLGGVEVTVSGFAGDIDLGIYRRTSGGKNAGPITGSGNAPGKDERTTISAAQGSYFIVTVPYATAPSQSYQGKAAFNLKKAVVSLSDLNKMPPKGVTNYRASNDQYLSHSEPSIAMDPLDHNHLVAGSKMYENLGRYLFKAGTYESYDGGKTWRDYGQLPGYCVEAGQCDPNDLDNYRVVSDIALAFDDEGNAYSNTLDAPGGVNGSGWNMTVHIKRPHQPWSQPITAHDNRNNEISNNFIVDDKNWITVDNNTDVDGGPNRPSDKKIGTIYVCWSFDGPTQVSQQIVLVRSTDGGKTWGGVVPGDNIPLPLSQKSIVSGIGCHVAIGPKGEVYATWYDNQLDALMQVKSTDRGHSFTPARPVAQIVGVNEPFEGQAFRNLSIPATAVDRKGDVYLVATSANGEGAPALEGESLKHLPEGEQLAEGAATCPDTDPEASPNPACSDIVLFKSTDGGQSYTGPVRVNQDSKTSPADQFQPWIAVTDKGQVNVSYFDRRRDPNNFFIDTYLSRSNDGGKTFKDTRASAMSWDPRINPPISPSGEFIGDYQGLVADDDVAIPFWNDTQAANLKKSDPGYSQYQEVFAARVLNVPSKGGPALGGTIGGRFVISRRAIKMSRNGIVPVRVSCRTPLGCGGRLRLRTARKVLFRNHKRRVSLGSRAFDIPSGKRRSFTVRVRVPTSRRSLVRRLRKLSVEAIASVVIANDIRGTVKRTFRLHRDRRPRRR
jgi:hypothetical protein